jgi:hypothetical protein
MPEKHKKVNGTWVAWQHPEPHYNPNLTNHERMLHRKAVREGRAIS